MPLFNIITSLVTITLSIFYITKSTETLVSKDINEVFQDMEKNFNEDKTINVTINNNNLELKIFKYILLDKKYVAISLINKTTENIPLITNMNINNISYSDTTKEFLIYSKVLEQKSANLSFKLNIWMRLDNCIRYEFLSV
jgi:hypothetical protein